MITCQTIGPVHVTVNGTPAPPELLWRKHLALLIYLALFPRHTRSREHLTGLLWPDKPDATARHSLNEALRLIRRLAGEQAVASRADQVTLASGLVSLDLDAFESAVARDDVGTAAGLVLGEFLEGFGVPGAPEFEDWLAAERLRWTDRGVSVLARWSNILTGQGRLEAAVAAAGKATVLDPVSDAAAQAVVRALALSGEQAAALVRGKVHVEAVRSRTGTEPSREFLALLDRVRKGRSRRPAESLVEAAQHRRCPLVGRAAELEAILSLGDLAGPAVAVVTGDSGTGKTRLVAEVAERSRLRGHTVCAVRAVPADREEAWSGILALARGGLLDAPGVGSASSGAIATFADLIPAWAERFVGAGKAGQGTPARALAEILAVVADEGPVLLWLDDAHYLDPESLQALAALPRDLPRSRLLILLAAGTVPPRDELDELRARIGRDLAGVSLALGPLGPGPLRDLVRWAFPGYGLDEVERLARRMTLDSAGLPLLLVELLNGVASGLELHGMGGAWPEPFKTLDQTLPDGVPDSVVAALRIGFRRLSDLSQRVLAAAAVLGSRVTQPDLCRAVAETDIEAALDELEWARWLVAEPRGYQFVARITRDVIARDMTTPGQRKRIMERMASGIG